MSPNIKLLYCDVSIKNGNIVMEIVPILGPFIYEITLTKGFKLEFKGTTFKIHYNGETTVFTRKKWS